MYRHWDGPLVMLLSQRECASLPTRVVSHTLPQIAGCWESIWKSIIICLFHFCTLPQTSAFDHWPWCVPKELPPVGGIASVKFGCQDTDPSLHKKARKYAAENYLWAADLHPLLAAIRKWILGYTDPVLPCTYSCVGAQSRDENWITSFAPLPFKIILDLELLKLLLGVFHNCFIIQYFWCWVVLLSLHAC